MSQRHAPHANSTDPDQAPRSAVITKTSLFKYIENFTTKNGKFQIKISDIFHKSPQNIDCRYSLEPPRQGGSNEYYNPRWGGSNEYLQSMFF